jgi:glycosidase
MGGADILASTYVRMHGFLFELPGALVADVQECTVESPGPLYLNSYLPPDTPYTKVSGRFISLSSAPDSSSGVFAVVNRKRNAALASWMDTGGATNYLSYLSGDGNRISVLHYDLRIDRMHRRSTIASDTHRIELVEGGLSDALARYRKMLDQTMSAAKDTPAWTREIVLLEVLPTYFADGIKGLTRKLPFYKEVGFNTIYIMPHWVGGYSPVDLYAVEPAIGSAEDLKTMVKVAHDLGMKVLFDMVIHGFNRVSPIVRERPEIFQKDEHGLIVPHQTWGSMSTDAASPAYRKYMIDLALHDLKTYDIDGYRVDANAYKMPNWDPNAASPPGISGPATRTLLVEMYEAMRKVKPDSVLLSEIFGPVWHSVCNLVHDNMTQGSIAFLEMIDRGEVTAESYKRHLARSIEALPEDALRVRFGRNHDTSWFYHFPGYTPRFMAFDAIHAFFGIPEIFAGDRKNPPHPDDDPAVYGYYRKLFAARKQFPELVHGKVDLRGVESDNPMVFTGLRCGAGTTYVVAISLSEKEEAVATVVHAGSVPAQVKFHDPISGASVNASRAGQRSLTLKMKPFQVLIGSI